MEAKIKKENKEEAQRLKQESQQDQQKRSETDSGTDLLIDKEKQLAIEKEMSQYRITPDIEEEATDDFENVVASETHSRLETVIEAQEEPQKEPQNPFESREELGDGHANDEDLDERYQSLFVSNHFALPCLLSPVCGKILFIRKLVYIKLLIR